MVSYRVLLFFSTVLCNGFLSVALYSRLFNVESNSGNVHQKKIGRRTKNATDFVGHPIGSSLFVRHLFSRTYGAFLSKTTMCVCAVKVFSLKLSTALLKRQFHI